MRYVSMFSGVEMASLAFRPKGWTPLAFAEIDTFASEVLRHHYPEVPNLGDVEALADDALDGLGPIDLFVMGFPCQDVSNAGERKGLWDEDGEATRTGLVFAALRHVRRAVERAGCRWLIGENVPGLLTSNAGRDFGEVVGQIVGAEFNTPRGGWQNSGAAAGPRGLVEWRVLDAQWWGVAQRRQRVFLVADFGDWTSRSPVLLERSSFEGHPPACVAARSRSVAGAPRRPGRRGIWRQIADAFRNGTSPRSAQSVGSLRAADGKAGADSLDAEAGRLVPVIAGPLQTSGATAGHRIDAEGAVNGHLLPVPLNDLAGAAMALNAKETASGYMDASVETFIGQPGAQVGPIPFDVTQLTHPENRANPQPGDPAPTLPQQGHPLAIAVNIYPSGGQGAMLEASETDVANTISPVQMERSTDRGTRIVADWSIRRLTPTEAERLMGVPDGYTNIPYRGRNEAPDGPRYRALGNGFVVPVMGWIAERIEQCGS